MILYFDNIVIENGAGWFAANNVNRLFCINFLTNEVQSITSFSDVGKKYLHCFTEIQKIENKIVLTPKMNIPIAVYDIELGNMKYYDTGRNKEGNLYSGFHFKNFVYFFAIGSKGIYRLDLKEGKVEEKFFLEKYLDNYNIDGDKFFWNGRFYLSGNLIYLLINNSNLIVEVNLINDDTKVYEVVDKKYSIYDISFWGEDFFLTLNNGEILRWNKEEGIKHRYELDKKESEDKKLRIVNIRNELLVLGAEVQNKGRILTINPINNSIKEMEFMPLKEISTEKFFGWEDELITICSNNQNGLFFQYKTGEFYKSNMGKEALYGPIEIDINEYIEDYQLILRETKGLELKDFIKINSRTHDNDYCKNIGIEIYEECFLYL